uniref:Uncharacterized protein n=1 Tax=Cacopsylla melanoneura TaxID=428564 RepID=A0A8D8ZB16_9HEMI
MFSGDGLHKFYKRIIRGGYRIKFHNFSVQMFCEIFPSRFFEIESSFKFYLFRNNCGSDGTRDWSMLSSRYSSFYCFDRLVSYVLTNKNIVWVVFLPPSLAVK